MSHNTFQAVTSSSKLRNLCVGLGMAIMSCSAMAANQINLGAVVWVGFAPFYVAEAQGFFKKNGVSAKLASFSDPALITSALTSGSIQGAMVTYDQVIAQAAKGTAIKVVMPVDYSYGGDAIVATKDVASIKNIKGHQVGYAPLSPSDFLLSYALKKNGLTEKDISPVNMAPEAVPAAMASGKLPVGVTYEPSLSQIVKQGGGKYHIVFSSKEAPGLIADVLAFDEKFIKSNPNDVTGIIRAFLDGLNFIKSKPDEAAKIIGKYIGVPAKEVKEQLEGVYLIPLNEMPQAFAKGKDTTSYFVSGDIIGNVLIAKGQITKNPPTESTIDAQFVKALQAK